MVWKATSPDLKLIIANIVVSEKKNINIISNGISILYPNNNTFLAYMPIASHYASACIGEAEGVAI